MLRLLPRGGVVESAVKSGVWVGMMNVGQNVLEFLRLMVLAALLTPEDFGLMGIALLTIAAFKQVTKLGVNDALVQDAQDDVNDYLDTAWLMNIARGVFILGAMWLGAPFIADFFGEARAVDILRVVAVVPLLKGFQNPAVVYFQKSLEFHKKFVHQLSGAVMDAIVGIALALLWGNVWALVFAVIAGQATRCLVSYLLADYRPHFAFEMNVARNLYGFGKWVTLISIFVFLTNQGDDIFVGWLLSASALGLYQFAYRLSNMPTTHVSKLISSVAFPTYSKIQDDTAYLREGYFRALKLVTFVAAPVTVGIVLTTRPFILGFLGEKWLPAVVAVQILAIWGFVRALGSTTGPLFKAIGRPDITAKIQFGKVLIIGALIWPATARWGIEGTAFVIVANAVFFSEPVLYHLIVKTLETSYRRLFRTLGLPVAASLVMGGCVYAVRETFPIASPIIEFAVLVAVGVTSYAALTVVMERVFGYGLEPIFRTIVSAMKSDDSGSDGTSSGTSGGTGAAAPDDD